eukprot:6359931-Pyramimonas_sp.AAC.1
MSQAWCWHNGRSAGLLLRAQEGHREHRSQNNVMRPPELEAAPDLLTAKHVGDISMRHGG